MRKTLIPMLPALLAMTLLFLACGRNVYVAGQEEDCATLWTNGVAQRLSSQKSEAKSVFASGSDVYVAGTEDGHPTLWKNGVAQRLSDGEGQANSVFVSGKNVYVAGVASVPMTYSVERMIYDPRGYKTMLVATLWVNGIEQNLGMLFDDRMRKGILKFDNTYSKATSVYVSDNDIYVAGEECTYLVLWKNDIPKFIDNSNTRGSTVYISGSRSYSGDQVFACGGTFGKNYLWRIDTEGEPRELYMDMAHSVFVSGKDVYVVGWADGRGGVKARLWKNGTSRLLTATHSDAKLFPLSVFASGGDAYVAILEEQKDKNNKLISYAALWKNGVSKRLSDKHSQANAVFVK